MSQASKMRMAALFIVLVITLVVSSVTTRNTLHSAQDQVERSQAPDGSSNIKLHRFHTRPLINGAETPERIPDDVAYRLMLGTLSRYPDETDDRRATAYLQHIGVVRRRLGREFDPEELHTINEVLSIANVFAAKRSELDSKIHQAIEAGDVSAEESTRKRSDTLLRDTLRAVETVLGADGSQKMHAFVKNHMKQHITVIE